MAARAFLGAGDIYVNRIVNGAKQGLAGPFYADKFEVKPNSERKEATSKGRYNYGQIIESVALQKPSEFTMDLTEVTGDTLLLAFMGTATTLAQTAGTLTDQAVTAKADKWIEVGKKNLLTVVVKNSAGSTTYVEGTDYTVNKPLGMVKVLSTGSIADAAALKVSGTYAAASGSVISGSTLSEVRAEIVFDGINQADGSQVTVNVWEGVLSTDSAFDFLANEFGKVSLKGTLKTPTGKTEPYTVTVQGI